MGWPPKPCWKLGRVVTSIMTCALATLVETEIDEFKCRRIDPMRIFEYEQDSLVARQLYELVDERLQCTGPLLLRRQAQGSVTSFGLQSKQRGKQGPVALGTDQHLFQAIELIVIVVVGLDSGGEA